MGTEGGRPTRRTRGNGPASVPLSDRHRAASRQAPSRQAPASAARRAAEALFAAEPQDAAPAPRPAVAAQVIVRRSRLPPGMPRPGTDAAAHPAADPSPPAKDPRVFRLVQALPTPDAGPAPDATPGPSRPRRARRASPERRPGPVTHVLTIAPRPWPSGRAADLAMQLSRVAPVLAEIERAQAFQFMDPQHDAPWQRLLQAAAVLAVELSAACAPADRPRRSPSASRRP